MSTPSLTHGKASTYRHDGCRCADCTAAANAETAAVRLRKRITDGPTEAERFAMEPLPGEQWRAAVGYQGYEVSNLGRVRSLKFTYPRILSQHPNRHGYLRVTLWSGNKSRQKFVHGLVMEAFVGPYPDGQEVRHLDDNKSDNRLVNLAYGTHRENVHDSLHNGTQAGVKKTHCKRGHAFDAANTRYSPDGRYRRCRACERLRWQKDAA